MKHSQQIDPNAGGSPFNGVPVSVPGPIEAEFFDAGGDGVAYLDTTMGNNGNVGGSVVLASKAEVVVYHGAVDSMTEEQHRCCVQTITTCWSLFSKTIHLAFAWGTLQRFASDTCRPINGSPSPRQQHVQI